MSKEDFEEINQKDDVYWKILNTAIKLDLQKGHQKWTISELARQADVSRPLIYYYFGKARLDIIENALKIYGKEMAGLTQERMDMWKRGEMVKSVMATRQFLKKAPSYIPYYYLYRETETVMGQIMRQFEDDYIKKLKHIFPDLSEGKSQALYALFLGMAFAPDIEDEAVEYGVSLIQKGLYH